MLSNYSRAAVQSFLDAHVGEGVVQGISAPNGPDPRLLKPSPHLVIVAIRQLGAQPHECALVGDSSTDVTAAHAPGALAIGHADEPGRHERPAAAGADASTDDLTDLTDLTDLATSPTSPTSPARPQRQLAIDEPPPPRTVAASVSLRADTCSPLSGHS